MLPSWKKPLPRYTMHRQKILEDKTLGPEETVKTDGFYIWRKNSDGSECPVEGIPHSVRRLPEGIRLRTSGYCWWR